MKELLRSITVAGTAAALVVTGAVAEPYLAIRTGLKCQQCHVNRTGGGGRSDFGSIYAQTMLPLKTGDVRSRAINDVLSVGFDVRTVFQGTFGSSTPRTSLGLDVANAFVEARLLNRALTLYVDETLGPGRAIAREAFALVQISPLNAYAKVGKFLLPYGLRIQDNAEYVRQQTGINYTTPDQGAEVGIEPGPLSLFVAVTNGAQGAAENDNAKQVTGTAALVFPRFRVGASASHNGGGTTRNMAGGFGGLRLGPLGVLGEADYIEDRTGGQMAKQFVGFAEGDLAIRPGINVKVTYGYLDPYLDLRTPGGQSVAGQKVRMRFGLETFPVQFLRLAAFYTLLQDVPQATNDLDRFSVELHVHF